MPYNNNAPLGSQTVASSTDPIRNNFAFLQTAINKEHNFDAADPTLTYHLKASMPNSALSPTKPAGTDGVYFVNSGIPYFFDGTTNFPLQLVNTQSQKTLSGVVTLTFGSANTIATVPAFSYGYYLIGPKLPNTTSSNNCCAMGFFVSSSGNVQVGTVNDPGSSVSNSGRSIVISLSSPGFNGTYNYTIIYFTP